MGRDGIDPSTSGSKVGAPYSAPLVATLRPSVNSPLGADQARFGLVGHGSQPLPGTKGAPEVTDEEQLAARARVRQRFATLGASGTRQNAKDSRHPATAMCTSPRDRYLSQPAVAT